MATFGVKEVCLLLALLSLALDYVEPNGSAGQFVFPDEQADLIESKKTLYGGGRQYGNG